MNYLREWLRYKVRVARGLTLFRCTDQTCAFTSRDAHAVYAHVKLRTEYRGCVKTCTVCQQIWILANPVDLGLYIRHDQCLARQLQCLTLVDAPTTEFVSLPKRVASKCDDTQSDIGDFRPPAYAARHCVSDFEDYAYTRSMVRPKRRVRRDITLKRKPRCEGNPRARHKKTRKKRRKRMKWVLVEPESSSFSESSDESVIFIL